MNGTTEATRLARIDSYAVIGLPPLPDLQALVGLAAQVCDVPSATINLGDGSGHQVASVGSELIDGSGPVQLHQAQDLVAPDGVVIGSLSVHDTAHRALTEDQRGALRILADRVVDALEHRLCARRLEQALAELSAARDETRGSEERIARFVDQFSHDLRNPVTAVSMSLQMLREQPSVAADDDAAWMVSRALNGTERLDSLIETLLVSTRDGGGLGRA